MSLTSYLSQSSIANFPLKNDEKAMVDKLLKDYKNLRKRIAYSYSKSTIEYEGNFSFIEEALKMCQCEFCRNSFYKLHRLRGLMTGQEILTIKTNQQDVEVEDLKFACIGCCQQLDSQAQVPALIHDQYPYTILYLDIDEQCQIYSSKLLLEYCSALSNSLYGGIILIGIQIQRTQCCRISKKSKIKGIINDKIIAKKDDFEKDIKSKLRKYLSYFQIYEISIIKVLKTVYNRIVIRLVIEPSVTPLYSPIKPLEMWFLSSDMKLYSKKQQQVYKYLEVHSKTSQKRQQNQQAMQVLSCKKREPKLFQVQSKKLDHPIFMHANKALLYAENKKDEKNLKKELKESRISFDMVEVYPLPNQIKLSYFWVLSFEETFDYVFNKILGENNKIKSIKTTKNIQLLLNNKSHIPSFLSQILYKEFYETIETAEQSIDSYESKFVFRFKNITQSVFIFILLMRMQFSPIFVSQAQLYGFNEMN